jgi:hypothetical protein
VNVATSMLCAVYMHGLVDACHCRFTQDALMEFQLVNLAWNSNIKLIRSVSLFLEVVVVGTVSNRTNKPLNWSIQQLL